MILADKITEERKKNGWSQEELANQLGVSRQAVSKWESAGAVPVRWMDFRPVSGPVVQGPDEFVHGIYRGGWRPAGRAGAVAGRRRAGSLHALCPGASRLSRQGNCGKNDGNGQGEVQGLPVH